MDRLVHDIQEQQKTGTGGYYGHEEGDVRTDDQRAKDFQADMAYRARVRAQEVEDARIADSLKKAREAIYGPEGGINAAGEFIHGGLLDRTNDSEAMRLKTFDEVDLTEQQRADLAAEGKYDFLQVGTTTIKAPAPKTEAIYDEEKKEYVRPSGEIMELAKRMVAQEKRIAAYQPLITAAWKWANAGGEGGPNQKQRGFKAQTLIAERSRAEEALTRMMNQSVQDRLPYSLQEFQTRFPDDFPDSEKGYAAGGIVPGNIGEPQMVVAHGGENNFSHWYDWRTTRAYV